MGIRLSPPVLRIWFLQRSEGRAFSFGLRHLGVVLQGTLLWFGFVRSVKLQDCASLGSRPQVGALDLEPFSLRS